MSAQTIPPTLTSENSDFAPRYAALNRQLRNPDDLVEEIVALERSKLNGPIPIRSVRVFGDDVADKIEVILGRIRIGLEGDILLERLIARIRARRAC